MPKWAKHMTLSQRNRYNESMRLQYIRRRIRDGHIPQPRITLTSKMRQVFRDNALEDSIYMLQDWMNNDLVKEIKEDKAEIKRYIRDQLPADCSRVKLNKIYAMLFHGEITIEQVRKLK